MRIEPVGGPGKAERVRGSLLGAACGDAVGAPFEGQTQVDAQRLHDWSGSAEILTYTDDTAMQRVLARHLAGTGGRVDQEALAREFSTQWYREPYRGYGAGPPRIFRADLAGQDWRRVAHEMFDGSGSLGNGGAMRTAPAAFVPGSLDHRVDLARQQAEITHTHPLTLDGAAALCAGIAVASAAESPFSTDWSWTRSAPMSTPASSLWRSTRSRPWWRTTRRSARSVLLWEGTSPPWARFPPLLRTPQSPRTPS